MDNLKIDSGHYRFEVEPKGAGSVAFIANYYYTSSVEQFEAPYNLKWNGSKATWTAVDGASSYDVILYDFNGQVKTVTVTDDWYDFSDYNPQDGWTFKVQADGDGKSTAKRSSNATESPAKTTSYNLTVVAYGIGNLPNTGNVSWETENDNQDFSTSVGGTFIKNTEVTVKAEANPGYEFVAWRVTAPENTEATLSTNAIHTFNLTSNLQLFAVFRAIPTEFSVTYHGNGASGYMAEETVEAGGTYTLKDCSFYTPDGTKFAGWAIGSPDATPLKQPSEEITINADTTIYAVWENLYFTTQPTNTSGKIGANVKLPVTIDLTQVHNDEGYNIVLEVKNGENWEKVAEAKRSEWNSLSGGFTVQQNSACTKEYKYKIYNGTEWIESDTFAVEFLPIIVTFVDNEHSTTTEPIEVDTVGGKISKPNDPTYAGDTFYGWNWPYWNFETDTVTQDITLYAQWAGRGYYGDIPDVYAKLGEKARIDLSNVYSNNSYTYVYRYDGANWIQVENVTNYGRYDLSASDVEKVEKYKIVISHSQNIESNEFTVTWTNDLPTYYVSYGVGEGQGSGGADYDIEHGTNYTLDSYEIFGTIVAPEGKIFDYWSIRVGENAMEATEIAQKEAGETITVTSNVYAIAMWKNAPTVTVSYYSVGNMVDSDTVAVGSQYTLMDEQGLEVPSGKQFKAWAIGGLGGEQKQPGDEITITEETYIYAVWELIPVPTGLSASYSGTVLAGNKLNLGSLVVRLQYSDGSEQPCAGLCEYWYDGSQIQDPINYVFGVELIGTRTVTVKYLGFETTFELKIVGHPITFNANGGSGTMPATEYVGTYTLPGCTFTAPSGKMFAGWATSAQGEVIGDTYSVTAAVEFFAIWQDPPHECEPVLQSGQPATCTVDGWKDYYACSCGANYEDADGLVSIPDLEAWKLAAGKIAAAHSGTPEWHQSATSHEKKYSCCDEIVVASEPHEWNNGVCAECEYVCLHVDVAVTKQDGQPATCTVDGWKDYYQCACGKYFADEARTTPIPDLAAWKLAEGKIAAAHSYGELIPQQDAVHTQTQLLAGMAAHYVCSVCHGYFDANKVATTENALIIPAPQHVFGDWVLDNEKHWKVCSCGLKAEESTHDYTDNDDMICNSCGYDRTLPHTCGSAAKQDGQSATCTLNGWKDYYKCSCGKLYQEEACLNEILSLEEWKNGDGKIAAAHSYGTLIAKVDPTCSAPGMAAHYECSVCHVLFDEAYAVKTAGELTLDIDPTAHTYGAWTSNGDGTHTRVCTLNPEHKENGNCAGGTATCTEKAVCSTCATAYGATAPHSHGSEWISNENEHWNECTCGDKANQAPHADGNVDGKCDVCGYAVGILSPEPDEDNEGLGAGAIAGIAVASAVVAGLGGFAIFWFVIKKKSIADLVALFKKK
ncbi:MAG: InlB B-repeat-containing protein [Clostridia bacterium]|nr:InlB B-repeat-containing protein [Clostridia bacterium]